MLVYGHLTDTGTIRPMQLNDTKIRKLPAPQRGNKITYDVVVAGFGVRVTAAGTKAFVLNYYTKNAARERRLTIGGFPAWTTAAAREEAKRLRRAIDAGADPVGDQQTNRGAPTVAELCDRFIAEHIPRKRTSTGRDYVRRINADILPALGGLKVHAVSFADIDALHRRIGARGSKIAANRIIGLASALFTFATKLGWRSAPNPCRGIERNHENKRTRYLSEAELTRLLAALDGCADADAANAVRLLLLTGARRGELLAARWSDFDLTAGFWRKPASTTKQKSEHQVPLSDTAVQVLTAMRERAAVSEWLFPASRNGGHRRDLGEAWEALRQAADLSDLRLHDLRHSFAAALASAGQSLPVIGALLGHATPQMTQRYSHLYDDVLRAATEKAASAITSRSRPGAKIIALK
jgi:integrase